MWNMSDRGIPRSYRTMEGFGVHTFRLVNAAGETHLVKFHWKPAAGVHSLVWEEAQIAAGVDPDFHRRDMADGIEAGAFLEYELGIQVMPDDGTDSFEGIDLLDPTKLVPEELAPVQLIGKLTLNRNPANYFAETEQVAFHTGNLVPGIEVTNDPLMQARLFSYLDTQLTRLGGPNFTQLPSTSRTARSTTCCATACTRPPSRPAWPPTAPTASTAASRWWPRPTRAATCRPRARSRARWSAASPVSFEDHFTQPAMFYRSLTPLEQAHIVEAFTFELGKCYEQAIKERELQVLANVDADLCAQVAAGLGLPAPERQPGRRRGPVARPLADRHRARPDRRPQDRHHRRRRRRPGRHRRDPQGGRQTRRDRPGHRPRRRCPWQRCPHGNSRPDAADHPLGRVRRPGRRRRHRPGR